MPNYYNAYPNGWQYGAYPIYANTLPQQNSFSVASNPQYMINVDGEMAARAWQMPQNLAPNTVIPLWDLDGQHVYFKSVDAYGRINPLRKGTVVFEDEQQNLPQSQTKSGSEKPDMSKYVSKDDFDSFKRDVKSIMNDLKQQLQNGSNNRNAARGDNR